MSFRPKEKEIRDEEKQICTSEKVTSLFYPLLLLAFWPQCHRYFVDKIEKVLYKS